MFLILYDSLIYRFMEEDLTLILGRQSLENLAYR